MNKSLFAFLTFAAVLYGVFSEAKAEDIIRYGAVTNEIKQVELKKEDDVFDTSADIKPLTVRMSESERQQENSSDLDYIEEDFQLPDLPCDSKNLKQQVENFILNSLQEKSVRSVVQKRERILMVRNMPDFEDVTDQKIDAKQDFNAASADAFLRINEHREIKHICKSSNEAAENNFKNVYVIIYPYLNFYKIVVTNLMTSTENLDNASFIYNW